jgi:hypothetical protein
MDTNTSTATIREGDTNHFCRRHLVSECSDVLADIVAWEPAPAAFELAVPPARAVTVVNPDDLSGLEAETCGVRPVGGVVVHRQHVVCGQVISLAANREGLRGGGVQLSGGGGGGVGGGRGCVGGV